MLWNLFEGKGSTRRCESTNCGHQRTERPKNAGDAKSSAKSSGPWLNMEGYGRFDPKTVLVSYKSFSKRIRMEKTFMNVVHVSLDENIEWLGETGWWIRMWRRPWMSLLKCGIGEWRPFCSNAWCNKESQWGLSQRFKTCNTMVLTTWCLVCKLLNVFDASRIIRWYLVFLFHGFVGARGFRCFGRNWKSTAQCGWKRRWVSTVYRPRRSNWYCGIRLAKIRFCIFSLETTEHAGCEGH